MALAAAAPGWEDAPAGRGTGTLSGLLPSIALHSAAIVLMIVGVQGGLSGRPAQTAPHVATVSLVPPLPATEPAPIPIPLPQWGLQKTTPSPQATPAAPDLLLEETSLPEVTSGMASLPLAVFATTRAKPEPAPAPEENAVAVEPAKPMPPPASVKVRKVPADAPAPSKPAAKAKPKVVAKPSTPQPVAKAAAKPVAGAAPAGDPTAKPGPAATSATMSTAPSNAQGAATAAGAPAPTLSDATVLVTNPNYAGACAIPYPERARRRNQEGTVLIHALIDTEGKPIEVTVASSSGHTLLDDAARVAIAGCAFVPQRVGGRAVKAIVEIPIPFKLI
jgi:periplasmic protein TonB